MSDDNPRENIFLGPLRARLARLTAEATNRCADLEAVVAEAGEAVEEVTHGRLTWRLSPLEQEVSYRRTFRLSLWDILTNVSVVGVGTFRPTDGGYPVEWCAETWPGGGSAMIQPVVDLRALQHLLHYLMTGATGPGSRSTAYGLQRPTAVGETVVQTIAKYAAKGPLHKLAAVAAGRWVKGVHDGA